MEQSTKDLLKFLGKAAFQIGKEVAPPILTNTIFSKIFGHRIETPIGTTFLLEDFPDLYRTKYNFKTVNKVKLTGYMYYRTGTIPNALIVFAHGFGGGGQASYMDVINALTERNYCVFAYDATGNDESEGKGMNGFPQQVVDLHNAIKFVTTIKPYNSLPIVLFGHSMGAYSVCNVLNFYPNVKAVVAASGFNKSGEIVKQQASEWTGEDKSDVLPYIQNQEEKLFGKYAKTTSLQGLMNTNAKVMIIHSEDDPVIPINAGYGIYYKVFKKDSRFKFIKFKNTGHGTVFYSPAGIKYANEVNSNYKKLIKQKNVTDEDKVNFRQTIDRKKYSHMINQDLFDEIEAFINHAITL